MQKIPLEISRARRVKLIRGGREVGRVPKNSLTMAAEPRRVMMSLDTVLDAISDLLLLPRYRASGSGESSPPALERNGSEWQAATASAAAAARCDVGMGDSEVVLLRRVD
jgi:hypothetical protein